MTATVSRLAADDRARFDEHLDSAAVTVVHDELRDAVEALRHAVSANREHADILNAVTALSTALRNAPTAEVACCPGRMVLIESGVWHGEITETHRCDCCGRVVTS